MTYNFDPDRWYDNERLAIDQRFRSGSINAREYEDAIDDLDCRFDENGELDYQSIVKLKLPLHILGVTR